MTFISTHRLILRISKLNENINIDENEKIRSI